jgi:hypothetical protein
MTKVELAKKLQKISEDLDYFPESVHLADVTRELREFTGRIDEIINQLDDDIAEEKEREDEMKDPA